MQLSLLLIGVAGIFAQGILAQEQKRFHENPQLSKLDSFLSVLEELEKGDTLYLKTLGTLARYLRQRDTDLAIHYGEELLQQSEILGDAKYIARTKGFLGVCHSMQGDYSTAIAFMDDASLIAAEHDLHFLLGSTKMNMGIVYKSLNDYPKSIAYYHEAWKIYDEHKFTKPLAKISNNLGNLYNRMGDREKALYYLKDAKKKHADSGDAKGFAAAQLNMGIWYLKDQQLSLAKATLDSVLTYVVAHNLISEEVLVLSSLGDIALKEDDFKNARYYLLSAIPKARQFQMQNSVFTCLSHLAILEAKQGFFDESLQHIQQAEQIADSLNSLSIYRDLSYDKSAIYQKLGDWEQALDHYMQYVMRKDSLQSADQIARFKSQQIQFDITQKNRALETQELELGLLKNKLLFRTRWQWISGFISLLLLFIGFLYYKKFKERKAFAVKLHQKNSLIIRQKEEIDLKNEQLEDQFQLRKKVDDTIYSFASSLSTKSNMDEVLEDIINNCISQLGFQEGSIYMMDERRENLLRKTFFSTIKKAEPEEVSIPVGLGLSGMVAKTGKAKISKINQLDEENLAQKADISEISVPLLHQDEVIGVLNSKHTDPDFFSPYHLDVLRTVSSICASKITQVLANEETQKARLIQLEGVKAKELSKLKSRFFANISHEFRTPLHLILAPLDGSNEVSSSEAGMMRRNAQRLLRLVNQLLDLTKIEHQQLHSERKKIEIFSFTSEIAKAFIPLAEQRNIQYLIDIPERDYLCMCDPDHLEKITYNLLSNAFKFTSAGKQVSIHLYHEKHERIKMTISDQGIGVPADQLPYIFDRFYQADDLQVEGFEGTGIGLSLTKELTDLIGGDIQVDSQVGKGSIFTLDLPLPAVEDELPVQSYRFEKNYPAELWQEDNASTSEAPLPPADSNTALILLVEDHTEMRSHLKKQLTENYRVIEAPDGEVGYELALQHVPDLIISDLMMPNKNGLTLIRDIRNSTETSHIPAILLTARDDASTRTSSFLSGAEQFLSKPFAIEELKARIGSLLDQRDILRDKYRAIEVSTNTSDPVENRDHQFLRKLVGIIEQNLDNETFSVQDLQKEAGMSRMQLHRKLKALVNQSTSEFIRNVRLQHAAQYLSQSGYQVAEVAYKVGFTHLSYFAKCFKDQYGTSPSEYGLS